MATTTTETLLWVGSAAGRGVYTARFAHDGKPVLFSGEIRVHRIGDAHDPARRYLYECRGYAWAAPRWFDPEGNPVDPIVSDGVGLATPDDCYKVILPVVKRLERSLSAEANPADLELVRVGLVDCWQYKGRARSQES